MHFSLKFSKEKSIWNYESIHSWNSFLTQQQAHTDTLRIQGVWGGFVLEVCAWIKTELIVVYWNEAMDFHCLSFIIFMVIENVLCISNSLFLLFVCILQDFWPNINMLQSHSSWLNLVFLTLIISIYPRKTLFLKAFSHQLG